MEKFTGLQGSIDGKVADAVQALLEHRKSEFERITSYVQVISTSEKVKNGALLRFKENSTFNDLLARLVRTPIGTVELVPALLQNKNPEPPEEKCRKRKHVDDVKQANYEDLQVLASFDGLDSFSTPFRKPTAVVALSDKRCFALSHGGRVSLFTPSATLIRTYQMNIEKGPVQSAKYIPISLAANPLNGQLLFTSYGKIRFIEPFTLPESAGPISALQRIQVPGDTLQLGIACSPVTKRLYTAENGRIVSYSLSDFSKIPGEWLIGTSEATRMASTFAVHKDGRLFYGSHSSTYLNAVPIDPATGNPEMKDTLRFHKKFKALSGVAFDSFGNVLVAEKGDTNRIQIFTEKDVGLAIFPLSDISPNAIAVLDAGHCGEFFSFGDVRCATVVAIPDYKASKIHFLGCPLDVDGI